MTAAYEQAYMERDHQQWLADNDRYYGTVPVIETVPAVVEESSAWTRCPGCAWLVREDTCKPHMGKDLCPHCFREHTYEETA